VKKLRTSADFDAAIAEAKEAIRRGQSKPIVNRANVETRMRALREEWARLPDYTPPVGSSVHNPGKARVKGGA
jgi:hypothetical protein